MNLFTYLLPYKWETVWTGLSSGYITECGRRITETDNLVSVLQYDRRKKIFKAYITNGSITSDLDINFLATKIPKVKEIIDNIQ